LLHVAALALGCRRAIANHALTNDDARLTKIPLIQAATFTIDGFVGTMPSMPKFSSSLFHHIHHNHLLTCFSTSLTMSTSA
jgi:hypothetical protein